MNKLIFVALLLVSSTTYANNFGFVCEVLKEGVVYFTDPNTGKHYLVVEVIKT